MCRQDPTEPPARPGNPKAPSREEGCRGSCGPGGIAGLQCGCEREGFPPRRAPQCPRPAGQASILATLPGLHGEHLPPAPEAQTRTHRPQVTRVLPGTQDTRNEQFIAGLAILLNSVLGISLRPAEQT